MLLLCRDYCDLVLLFQPALLLVLVLLLVLSMLLLVDPIGLSVLLLSGRDY